ncbi:fatty acid desaturase family protein [Roseivirga seohaensis]|uniref:fatty acid desaturase family protein n=1 Tax=Roseivirga seohaensis TaxID=1914963 RepID=UPI0009EDFE85|nr:acyl-CoA desaturase [Roseivirga seohaensis]
MNPNASEHNTAHSKKKFQKVIFDKFTQDGFQKDVIQRVDQYFTSNNISKTANSQMVFKTIWILIGWIATYALVISGLISPIGMFFLALAHGFFSAMIGLNIAHDAIHGSYTKNQKLNERLGLTFNFMGANDYVWKISHNLVHHTYTNIPDHDGDIDQPPILRLQPNQDLWWVHRFQHIYAYFLYSLATVSWVFVKDYVKFFQHQLGGHYRKTFPRKEIFRLFFYKALYYTVFLVIPIIVIDLPWYWVVFGFIAGHLLEGFTVAVIFMLAHIIEGTSFPEPKKDGKIGMPWADLQMHTTANFAIKNKVVNYLFGGLNFQIEHHLFPKICHVHYPKIAQIVKETAKEHDLPYVEHETFFGAVASHTRFLKQFGTTPKGVLVPRVVNA